jgi:hypothetical protein
VICTEHVSSLIDVLLLSCSDFLISLVPELFASVGQISLVAAKSKQIDNLGLGQVGALRNLDNVVGVRGDLVQM